MFESGLDNELVALDTGFENSTMEADKPLYGANSKVGRGRADVIVGEDGNFYNEDGERVYYWVVPAETDSTIWGGSETKGIGQDLGGYYTESEIRGAWDAKEGMGYLKKQVSWGNYWGFIQERQGLIQTGDLPDPTTREYMADYPATGSDLYPEGDPPPTNVGSSFGGGRDEEIYIAQQMAAGQDASQSAMENWVQLNAGLMSKYGIPAQWQNGDGDLFVFNGSTFSRVFKAEGPDWGKMVAGIMVSAVAWAVAGPTLVSAFQGAGMSAAVAKGAAAAVLSGASQGVTEGEIDLERALIAAVTAYGGSQLSDALAGSGVLGEVGDKITAVGDALVENGGDVLTAALSAGGISAVTQLVMDGEIDWKSAAIAAAMAGGTVALKEFLSGIGKPDAEGEVLEEISVDAQRKGTQVGEGLYQLDDGTVISDTGNVLGNMSDLDLDGDGVLNANDLQGIDPNNDYVGDNVYGDVDLAPPGSTTNPTAFTKEWMDERYAGMTRDQMIDQMARDGFEFENGNLIDPDALAYLNEWDATNDLNLQELNTASYGGIDVNMEDPYTIGQTEDGTYYIAKVSEDGGVSFTTISESQYNDLYAKMYGSPDGAGALTSGDYSDVENYINQQGIGSTGYEYENYNPSGTTIVDPDGDGIINTTTGLQPGSADATEGDGWITLKDPDGPASQVDLTDTTDDQTVTSNADNTSPTGDPNNSTDEGGSSTADANNSSPGNSGQGGADAPKPADAYSEVFIQAIADATNNAVDEIVERINNGESPSDIFNDPTGANVVKPTNDGDTTVTPGATTGGGTNTGTDNSGESGNPDAEPKDGDACVTSDGRKGVIANGACVFVPSILSVDPSVWAGDDGNTGGTTDDNNSGSNNNDDNTGTTTDAATPGKPDTGTTPGVLVVADDVWGTGTQGDGNTGSGDGTGDGEGDGDGSGGGGSGGEGAGRIVSGAQGSNTQWSPLYPGTKFRRFDKRARQGMMSQISQPNFSQDSRQNLYAGMFSDLMKGKA